MNEKDLKFNKINIIFLSADSFKHQTILYELRCESSGFPTRPHTNRAVQPQKASRGLKFRI